MTTTSPARPVNPTGAVDPDGAVEQIIEAVWRGDPAVIVPSPPGAGKSSTIERVAYAIAHLADRRVAVACNTNTQVVDLVSRTAAAYPDMRIVWLARNGTNESALPYDFVNVDIVHNYKSIPEDARLIFSTTTKWQYTSPPEGEWFADLLVVDEAWQCSDVMFAQIAGLAPRYLLVGDPGQIAPVVTVDVTRWRHRPDGPHQPAPVVLLEREKYRAKRENWAPGVSAITQIALPATRRFGPDTTSFVQPAFYPDLPFKSIRPQRYLAFKGDAVERTGPEKLLAGLGEDREIVVGVLPGGAGQHHLSELANTAAGVVAAALRTMVVVDEHGQRPLTPQDVGVVCAHVANVTSVQAALGPDFQDVWVDTAERWQGAERELIVVWDPMAGKVDLSDFTKDAGRMCVMLSRHRSGCVLLTQDSTEDLLKFAAAGTDRILSSDIEDPAHRAWRAQTTLRDALIERMIDIA
jgi:hypothetical protein